MSILLDRISQKFPLYFHSVKLPKPADAFVEAHLERLDEKILRAVPKRQAEFISGRLACSHAIENLRGVQVWVKSKATREPDWPAGIVGSISHNDHVAVAVVGKTQDFLGLGYDLEECESEKSNDFLAPIYTEKDHTLKDQLPMEPEVFSYLLFSAKEALFKCLFPTVKVMFGFECCYMSELQLESGSFFLTLTSDLHPFKAGEVFKGYFDFQNETVETLVLYERQKE